MRHRHRPLVLAVLALASLGACGTSPDSTPSPSSVLTGDTGTTIDPCALPPTAGPRAENGGSLPAAPPVRGSVSPPGTTGASEACRDAAGAAQGAGAGGGNAPGADTGGAGDTGQDPTSGTRLGDTGSGGSSSGPSGGSTDGPVTSVESDRPPAGY
jgi:hypothetical protein